MRHVLDCVFVYVLYMCSSSDSVQLPMGIFSRRRFFFFCDIAKALCMVTKVRSVEDNERNGEGMLSPPDRNVSPLPRSQCSIQPLAPGEKKHAILKYQVTLCVSHSLYHCHVSVYWLIQDCQMHRRTRGLWTRPLCSFESNESHPLIVICRVA